MVISNSLDVIFSMRGAIIQPVPAPVIVMVGVLVYPLPFSSRITSIILSEFVLALAVAVTPPGRSGALIVIEGSIIYPVP